MPLCHAPLFVGSLVCSRVHSPDPMPCLPLYDRTLDTSVYLLYPVFSQSKLVKYGYKKHGWKLSEILQHAQPCPHRLQARWV